MENKEIVKRYWEGKWNTRRPELLDELQALDVVYHGPGLEMTSREEYKQAYAIPMTGSSGSHRGMERFGQCE